MVGWLKMESSNMSQVSCDKMNLLLWTVELVKLQERHLIPENKSCGTCCGKNNLTRCSLQEMMFPARRFDWWEASWDYKTLLKLVQQVVRFFVLLISCRDSFLSPTQEFFTWKSLIMQRELHQKTFAVAMEWNQAQLMQMFNPQTLKAKVSCPHQGATAMLRLKNQRTQHAHTCTLNFHLQMEIKR